MASNKVGFVAVLLAAAMLLYGCLSTSEGTIGWHILNRPHVKGNHNVAY